MAELAGRWAPRLGLLLEATTLLARLPAPHQGARRNAFLLEGYEYNLHTLPLPNFLDIVWFMELTPFELTPEQKNFLESLSRQTGESISALIARELKGLREEERPGSMHGHSNDGDQKEPPQNEAHQPLWEQFADAFKDIPEEKLNRLPVDGAAKHDHYIYGAPKRPT